MVKTKVINIISDIDRWVSFEWITERLDPNRFELIFVLLNSSDSYFEKYLLARGLRCYRIPYSSKKDLLSALWRLFVVLREEKPEVTHCHFLPGGLIGLTASFLARVRRRIYTRRHGSQHADMARRGLLYDRYMNFLATHIIATGRNVEQILLNVDHAPARKVSVIHHGFNFADFDGVSPERVESLRRKYRLMDGPVIGVISRFVELKGVQYIVPAFRKLLESHPKAILLMANCFGDFKPVIDQQLATISGDRFRQIYFEEDIFALYKLMDVFVHVPINPNIEAFGQIYIEALASRVPSVFTMSGVAKEFIVDRENAMVVDFKNADQIYTAMKCVVEDRTLRDRLVTSGYQSVLERFSIDKMVSGLDKIYDQHGFRHGQTK